LLCVVVRPGLGLGLSLFFLYSPLGMMYSSGMQMTLEQYNFVRFLRRSMGWSSVTHEFDRVAFLIPNPTLPLTLIQTLTLPLTLIL
jgi:hypothetical protein